MSHFIIGGTNVLFYYRWHKCHGGTYVTFYIRWDKSHLLAIGGTNVSFLVIGGTNVDLIEGGTNVGGTNVGWTNVGGRKVAASCLIGPNQSSHYALLTVSIETLNL